MKLIPYPEYKDSGLPWLGKIPSHWETVKVKYIFSERIEKGYPDQPLLAATQTKGVIPKTHYENRTVMAQLDLHLLKLVNIGDFVISLRSFQGGLEYAYYRGIISPAYTVMIPMERVLKGYFRHLFKSAPFIKNLSLYVTGIRQGQNIDYFKFKNSLFLLPPEQDQRAMASYLDFKTKEISRFIRGKRRLIELLKEQKQAIINRAVTRGLDPEARLKPSGVDWLGHIPEHWEAVPLRWHISILSGDFIAGDRVSREKSFKYPYPVIGGNGLMGFTNAINCTSSTIVIGRVGALCGNVHLIKAPSWITDNALRINRVTKLDHEYLAFQLQCLNLNRLSNANAQPLITGGIVKSQRVALPSINEQKHIVEYIKMKSSEINTAIARAEREIELIREYRTRLIADVVTGKVDVRDIPVAESPEIEEPEELDSSLETAETAEPAGLTETQENPNEDQDD